MSATVTTPRRFASSDREGFPRPRRLTLEELLEARWQGLRSGAEVDCPLCEAPIVRTENGMGRCRGCGSTLS